MADEKKTYLLNVESNLKALIDDAIKAKKEVDRLTESTNALKKAGLENTAEYQMQSAQLKVAKQNYNDLQKVVAAGIQLTNKELSYRQQLTAAISISVQNIKNLGNGYIKNAQGIDILNPKLIAERQNLKNLNEALIEHDLSLKSGKTNVGLYRESIEALIEHYQSLNSSAIKAGSYGESVSAAFKEAGKSILSMVSPIALITAGIALAKKVFNGLKEAIMSTTGAIDFFNIAGQIWQQMMYDIIKTGGIAKDNMIEVAKAQAELNLLRVEEYGDKVKLSVINRKEQALREQSIDRTKTHAERLILLNKVKDLESQKTAIQVERMEKELAAIERIIAKRPTDEKQRAKALDLMAKINDAYAAEDAAMQRVQTQRTSFMQEEIKEKKASFDRSIEMIDELHSIGLKEQAKELFELNKWYSQKYELAKDNEFELANLNNLYAAKNLEIINKLNEERKKASEELKKLLQDEKNEISGLLLKTSEIINAEIKKNETLKKIDISKLKWNKDVQKQNEAIIADGIKADNIATETWIQNREAAAAALGALSEIVGAETEAGKFFAAAQATINTWLAASMTMTDPTIRSTFARIVMTAAVVMQGLAQVKNILAVKTTGETSIRTGPTSISATLPAQRNFATPAGSTIFTQPQLTQPQLNALPNQNLLTAADIANALKNLPAPIVTVEDINAKVKAVNKVNVRANI